MNSSISNFKAHSQKVSAVFGFECATEQEPRPGSHLKDMRPRSSILIAAFFAACVGLFALLTGVSEWFVRSQVAPADTLERHVALFSTTHSPYAAFGDSHVARGFDAQTPVVNLAFPSENLDRMDWKAARYLDRVKTPEMVLIQADPHLFAPYRLDAGIADYPEIFGETRGALIKAYSDRYRPQLLQLWRSYFWNDWRMVSTIEVTSQGALLSPGDISTWSRAEQEDFTRKRVALHQPIENLSQSGPAKRYRRMVERFIEHGAEVCLAALPTSPLYRDEIRSLNAQQQAAWAEAIAFYESLAAKPGVRFVDHRSEYSDLALFRDPDHLNKKGAIEYSPRLQAACFDKADPDRIAAVE